MKQKNKAEDRLEIESVRPLSPHNEALYEVGKEMLKSSIRTARDFCKFMITVCTGSIPTYLGLLKLVLPTKASLSQAELIISYAPPFLFLVSAVVFIFGYFPQSDYFSLDIIDEIKIAYEETVKKRRIFIILGTNFFSIGTFFAILNILIHIIKYRS